MDDGATSSWLGPLLVGAQRRSDGRIEVARIEPEVLLSQRRWAQLISIATVALVDGLGGAPGDRVLLCRGNLFNEAAPALQDRGFQVDRGVITGPLQLRLTQDGRKSLGAITGNNKMGSVSEQLAWVARDPDHRLQHVRAFYRERASVAVLTGAAFVG